MGRIAGLERRNLLLVGLDDRHEWFRYHALFAEFLAHRLWATDPDDAAALHRRAAAWFLGHELVEDAVEHARACADHETVARVLAERHLGLSRSGRQVTLLRWVDGLPEEVLLAHPTVIVGAALNAGAIGRPAVEVRRRLALAERAGERHPELWTDLAGRRTDERKRSVEGAVEERVEPPAAEHGHQRTRLSELALDQPRGPGRRASVASRH
jgi:LuxR family maltose regulon positive regulatory protein